MLKNTSIIALSGLLACLCVHNRVLAQEQFTADKVIAVVGHSVVLYSELDKFSKALVEQRKQQGYTSERDPKCEALEQLIVQKLLYNQSQIDSLKIPTDRISDAVQSSLDEEIIRHGSVASLELFYHKPIFEIRKDLQTRYEESSYASEMEKTIKDKVHVTPGEVEKFYRNMPKDSMPVVPEQYIYAQIARYPANTEDAKLRAKERLLELRERILKGDKFDAMARNYSDDGGSAIRGGDMGMMTKEMFVAPFGEALSNLKIGQVSGVVETDFGFHIIQLLDKLGNQYRCRHILIKPRYTDKDMEEPYDLLDSVQKQVVSGKITFEEAVTKYSEDKYSKQNGGVVTNLDQLEAYDIMDPTEASTKFFKENLGAEDYKALQKLKVGDVSIPFASQDIRQNLICKIIKLKEIVPTHPASLKDDYLQVERLALAHKQKDAFVKWLEQKAGGMYIRVDKEYRDCEFTYKFLLK